MAGFTPKLNTVASLEAVVVNTLNLIHDVCAKCMTDVDILHLHRYKITPPLEPPP